MTATRLHFKIFYISTQINDSKKLIRENVRISQIKKSIELRLML